MSVNWAECKKNLVIIDEDVVEKNTGVVISYCTIEEKPEEIRVKL